jgi:hypothetical protein
MPAYTGHVAIPRELTSPVPRKLRLSGKGSQTAFRATLMFAIAFALTLWYSFDAVQQMRHRAVLRQDGSTTTGEITRLWSSGRGAYHKVSYTFTVNGSLFTGEAQVPKDFWDGLQGAGSLPVRYVPTNPVINHPNSWEWSALQKWDAIFAGILSAAFGLFFFLDLYLGWRLCARGLAVSGVVTACSPNRKGRFQVKYEFRTKDGSMMAGSGLSPDAEAIGACITAIYLPQSPRQNALYPFANYRVVQ